MAGAGRRAPAGRAGRPPIFAPPRPGFMTRPASTDPPSPSGRERWRAIAYFTVAGTGAAALGAAVLFSAVLGSAALIVIALSSGSAAVAAAVLWKPLARARAGRQIGWAAFLGAVVAGLAYLIFAVVYSLADHGASWAALARAPRTIEMALGAGIVVSPALALFGGLAGALYARRGPRPAPSGRGGGARHNSPL